MKFSIKEYIRRKLNPKYNNIFDKKWWEETNEQTAYHKILHGVHDEETFLRTPTLLDPLSDEEIKDKIVLDVGCGIGRLSMKALDRGAKKYIGIDFSKQMIEIAKRRSKRENIKYYLNDGETIPLNDESVDIAVVSLVFQHCTKEVSTKYMKEIQRVLKSKGMFIAHIPKEAMYVGGFRKKEVFDIWEGYHCREDILGKGDYYHEMVFVKVDMK